MGQGARAHMAEHGVRVLTGVQAGAPDALIAAWLEGRLATGENACDGSGDHHHTGGAPAPWRLWLLPLRPRCAPCVRGSMATVSPAVPSGRVGWGLGFAVHVLEAEVVGRGGRCAQAQAKFMAGGGPEAAADTVTERRSGDSG
jgi:hypothetical protein